MKTILTSKGRIVLPAKLRRRDRLVVGQQFEIERLKEGQYLLKREPLSGNLGIMDWLLACPEKGWFQPINSESTDSLK